MAVPPLQLPAPPVAPADPFGGLLGTATVLPLPNRGEAGVEYAPDSCEVAHVTPAPCIGGADPADPFPDLFTDTGDTGGPGIISLPFHVWGASHCSSVGTSWEYEVARARRNLEQGEGRAVEAQLWNSTASYAPNFRDEAAAEVLPAAGSLVEAVGAAEELLGSEYAFTGMIHAGRRVAAYAAEKRLIIPDKSRPLLRAPAGAVWVFGGGYTPFDQAPNTTPAHASAAAWLYVTGWITAYRTEIWELPPDQAAGLDRSTNTQTVYAGRTYVLTWQCVTAAIPITDL